jgi:hypothetical protein
MKDRLKQINGIGKSLEGGFYSYGNFTNKGENSIPLKNGRSEKDA